MIVAVHTSLSIGAGVYCTLARVNARCTILALAAALLAAGARGARSAAPGPTTHASPEPRPSGAKATPTSCSHFRFVAQRLAGCPPGPGLDGASDVALSPDGRFVYVAGVADGTQLRLPNRRRVTIRVDVVYMDGAAVRVQRVVRIRCTRHP
jgi:hypothetical protein